MELTEKINKAGFKEIYCSEGHWITDWKEGDDIVEFNACKVVYTGVDRDINDFRCITDEEKNRLEKMADEAVQERMNRETMNNEVNEAIGGGSHVEGIEG